MNLKNNQKTLSLLCLLVLPVLFCTAVRPVSSLTSHRAILLRIDSAIDYKTVDLVDETLKDIQDGKADALLVQVDGGAGYLAPTLNIVNKLRSLSVTTVAYVGPNGAVASAYAAYLAMASTILAMNQGTAIGMARITPSDSQETDSLMNLMRELAISRGRNAEAAGRMTIDNLAYSAEEAYARGVCDLVVDSYESLLEKVGLDAADVIEKTPNLGSYVNSQDSYAFFKLLVDPTTIKYLFFAVAGLVCLNLLFSVARPRKTRKDETYQPLLDLMRMEIQSSFMRDVSQTRAPVHETPLQAPTNIPSDPTFRLNRLPTLEQARRIERPLEVRKR